MHASNHWYPRMLPREMQTNALSNSIHPSSIHHPSIHPSIHPSSIHPSSIHPSIHVSIRRSLSWAIKRAGQLYNSFLQQQKINNFTIIIFHLHTLNNFTIIIFHLHTLNTFNLCKTCKHVLCNFYLFLFCYFCLIKIYTIFLLSHSLLCLIFANTVTHIKVYLLIYISVACVWWPGVGL